MKHFLFFLKVIFPFWVLSLTITAQERYKDVITDSVRVETFTYAFKDSQSLNMDVYFPAFENQAKRALNILRSWWRFLCRKTQRTRNSGVL